MRIQSWALRATIPVAGARPTKRVHPPRLKNRNDRVFAVALGNACSLNGWFFSLRLWFLEVRPPIVGSWRRGCGFACGLGGGGGLGAFAVRFFQIAIGGLLRAAGIVIRLLGLAVFVHRAFTLTEQIKNHAEVDMPPDFSPFFRRLGYGLQRFAERVCGSLIILLIEKRFAHAKICQWPPWLDVQSFLILLDGVVVATGLGKFFAARNRRTRPQAGVAFEDDVIRIDLDPAGLRPPKRFHGKSGFGSSHVHGFDFRIAFRVDLQLNRHRKSVQRLLDFADYPKPLWRAVDDELKFEIGHAG